MKLGEMLVRDGRLSEEQLDAALKYQARDGGRLGTVLVEHGFVDLEALTVYLGLELGIPIATGAMLERAKRAAVRLLQPAQAFKQSSRVGGGAGQAGAPSGGGSAGPGLQPHPPSAQHRSITAPAGPTPPPVPASGNGCVCMSPSGSVKVVGELLA